MRSQLIGALAVALFAAAGGVVSRAVAAETDVNVLGYGAVADGITDSTAAFQKAIDSVNASNTITANRIEWNRLGGMRIHQGRHYCINANYFDRSGSAGLQMTDSENITFTGNQFWRSGRPDWDCETKPYSAHAVISSCRGITFSSNNMNAGRDDDKKGRYSPKTAIVLEKLTDCVVVGNTGHRAYLETFIEDRGGHVNSIVRDNVGSPMGEPIVLDVGVEE